MHKYGKILFVIFVAITCALFLIWHTSPISAHEESQPARQVVAQKKLEKGKTEMNLTLTRLALGKMAAVIEVPIKSDAKIDNMYLESPSGKRYKAKSVKSIPASQLEGYLNTVSIEKRLYRFCRAFKSFLMPEAHATCGSCGVEAGPSETETRDRRAEEEAAAAFLGLLKRASQTSGIWVTVCIFEIEEEPGEWSIIVIYYEKGKRSQIKTAALIETPEEEPSEKKLGGPTVVRRGGEGPEISIPTVPTEIVTLTPPAISSATLRLGIDITKCPYPWLPEKDKKVTFTAKIYRWVGGQGWVYPGPPRVITFKLSDVSKEKGICMNKGDETTPDLYFKDSIPGFILSGGAGGFYDTARTQGPVTTATVTVTSDDYGSFAWIKSSAPRRPRTGALNLCLASR